MDYHQIIYHIAWFHILRYYDLSWKRWYVNDSPVFLAEEQAPSFFGCTGIYSTQLTVGGYDIDPGRFYTSYTKYMEFLVWNGV